MSASGRSILGQTHHSSSHSSSQTNHSSSQTNCNVVEVGRVDGRQGQHDGQDPQEGQSQISKERKDHRNGFKRNE